MILVVLGFISFFILVVSYWDKLNPVILVPVFLFLIMILFKIGKDFAKYGIKGALKGIRFKDRKPQRKAILFEMVSTLPAYQQTVITGSAGSDFLYLAENGLYLFKMIDLVGTIEESEKPEFWVIIDRMDKAFYPNLLRQLKKESIEWSKYLEKHVQPFLVLSSFSNLIGPKDPEVIVEKERNFIYELDQNANKKIYTKEEIDNLYRKAMMYSVVK